MSTAQTYSAIAASGALILSIFNTARAEVKGIKRKRAIAVELITGNRYRLINSGRKDLIVSHTFAEPSTSRMPEVRGMFKLASGDVRDFSVTPIGDSPFPTSISVSVEGQVGWLNCVLPPPGPFERT